MIHNASLSTFRLFIQVTQLKELSELVKLQRISIFAFRIKHRVQLQFEI